MKYTETPCLVANPKRLIHIIGEFIPDHPFDALWTCLFELGNVLQVPDLKQDSTIISYTIVFSTALLASDEELFNQASSRPARLQDRLTGALLRHLHLLPIQAYLAERPIIHDRFRPRRFSLSPFLALKACATSGCNKARNRENSHSNMST